MKELQKLQEEFDKALRKTKKHGFKLTIWRFIKDENALTKVSGQEACGP